MRVHSVMVWGCTLLLVGLVGCSGSGSTDQQEMAPVQGTITLDGEPLAGASVMFGGVAVAETDANGHYQLSAPVGENMVVVEKWVMPDGSAFKSQDMSPHEAGAQQQLPPKYSVMGESELRETVPPEGGTIDIELTSGAGSPAAGETGGSQ